jgi:hypothetical protein
VTVNTVGTSLDTLNIFDANEDRARNLQHTIDLPQSASSATLLQMTQLTSATTGPDISATSDVTIQGAT